MTLEELIGSITMPGWDIDVIDDNRNVRVGRLRLPEDSRNPGHPVKFDYADTFQAHESLSPDQIVRAVFTRIQYLTDHELREQFMVGNTRYFEPHRKPVITGLQKEWWVAKESAVDGGLSG